MSNLIRGLNLEAFQLSSNQLAPSLFTKKQIELILKKSKSQELTPTERAYFSRTITKKLNAINLLCPTEGKYFFNGTEYMLPERKEKALALFKRIEKNHKNLKILISGSFLYSKAYHDLDLFIISKYEKEDFKEGIVHYNYLKPEAVNTLFFNSLTKICLANFNLNGIKVEESITSVQIISKYQEIMRDLFNQNKSWLKTDLREFIIDCYYAGQGITLNSLQLKLIIQSILKSRKPEKILQRIFINALLMGFNPKKIKSISLNLIKSYHDLIKDYNHKEYYQKMIQNFREVLSCAG